MLAGVALFTHTCTKRRWPHRCSHIRSDPVRQGKWWMFCVDAVASGEGENPLWARPDQGSRPFSLTKLRHGSLRPLLTVTVWADATSHRPPSYILTSLRYNFLLSQLPPLPQIPTSLHADLSLLLCPARCSTGFYL